MKDFRRLYLATRFASLDWSQFCQRPVEIVASASHANFIGLWRASYGQELKSLFELREKFLEIFRKKFPRFPSKFEFVTQAIYEYVFPACRVCRGRSVVLPGVPLICGHCHGTGIELFTDERRAVMMSVPLGVVKEEAPKLTWLLGLLGHTDKQVNRQIGVSLGR